MTLLANIITPFLHCQSPEEAKEALDAMKDSALGPLVHKVIFKKGLINNMPEKLRKVMLPHD